MRATLFLLKKIRQYDKSMIAMIVFFSLLSAVYPFIWVYVPMRIIRLSELPAENFSEAGTQLTLLLAAAAVVSMTCAWSLAFLRGNYRMRMNNVRYRLIRDLMRYSLTMPYENTLNKEKLDAIQKAREAVKNPWNGAGGLILTLLQVFGTGIAAVGFISVFISLSFWLMLFVAAVILSNLFINRKVGDLEQSEWDGLMPELRKLDHLFSEQQDPSGRKDILSYSLYGLFKAYIDRYFQNIRLIQQSVIRRKFSWQTALAAVDFVKDAVLYGWLIRLFLAGTIDAALFFFYGSSVVAFVALAQQLMADITKIRQDARHFSDFMALDTEADAIASDGTSGLILPRTEKGVLVEIKNVSFRYPGTERWVLRHLNLTIRRGEKMALVGENGSGKTTLILLLSRLYRPVEGEILFDGINIRELSESSFRSNLSVVFQDAMILPFSIRENIAMSPDTDEKRLYEAMDNASFSSVAETCTQGVDTTLLRILDDNGVDLSGGERQKLFLARALYKGKSRLLLLDEPTAALDPLAEQELYRHYHEMTSGQTSLFVSHRLASTQFCDRVAFLSEGRVAELGSHSELIARDGLYRGLYDLQAKNYREGIAE